MFEANLLSQVNVESVLPTVIETHFVRVIDSTMHDAFRFAHALLADSYPWLAPAGSLPHSSTIFFALWGLLQANVLHAAHATFGELLFGLSRARLVRAVTEEAPRGMPPHARVPFARLECTPLGRPQRLMGLLSTALIPWLRLSLRRAHERAADTTPEGAAARARVDRAWPRLGPLWHAALAHGYPLVHFAAEAASLACLAAYSLERSPFSSPLLWASGVVVRRMTAADARNLGSNGRAQTVLLVVRLVLLTAVFSFRILEWRNHAARNQPHFITAADLASGADGSGGPLEAAAAVAPPPPLAPAAGKALPGPGVCPVCGVRVTNAAVLAASGVIGCYPCLTRHVEASGRCPVSDRAASVAQIRRIYEA